MDLDKAIEKISKIKILAQGQGFIENPATMSKAMASMSVYAGLIEEKLAEYERDYEIRQGQTYHQLLVKETMSATAAEKHIKIELAELKGQIAFLSRIVASTWREIGVWQSRINHLVKLSETTNL